MQRFLALGALGICGMALAPRGDARVVHVARAAVVTPSPDRPAADGSCPVGTFSDNGACVHLESPAEATEAPVEQNSHQVRSGRWELYDEIPRRPDRPADYDAYVYPVPPGLAGGHSVLSGFDLDRPDERQRRGPTLHATGHGGVDLPQARGTPVAMIALDHQQGDAQVVYTGTLFGTTVITRHTVREGGGLHDYILLFGHLESIAPGLAKGQNVRPGDVIGRVGDTGSPELVHLHLEARRVRAGVDILSVTPPNRLLAAEVSVVCDPRNVLPLKPGR